VLWISYCQDGVQVRESSGSKAHAVARDLLRKRNGEQEAGTLLSKEARKLTVREALALLVSDYERRGCRSLRAVKGHVATWNLAMGDFEVAKLDFPLLDAQARDWFSEGGASAATINRRMASLRKAIGLAVRHKLAASRIEVPHLEERAPRDGFLTPADFAVLASHLPDDGLRLLVRFLYATGMRVGEARQLEWRDVDGAVLRIRGATTKNGSARTLPIAGAVAEIIADARQQRRLDCPNVFHRQGEAIGLFRKSWATATKAAGHEGLLVHDLRRSAVRNLIRSGVPERIAMGVTGHKTRNVFDRYNIVSAADLDAGLQTVGAYLANASKTPTVEPLSSQDSHKVCESSAAAGLSR
jgi:integrase